jgi:hypothetical protein
MSKNNGKGRTEVDGLLGELDFTILFLGVISNIRCKRIETINKKGEATEIKPSAVHIELICYLFKRHLEGNKLNFTGQEHIANDFNEDLARKKIISKTTVSRCLKIFTDLDVLSMGEKDDLSGDEEHEEDKRVDRPLKIRFNYGKYLKDS